MSEYRPTEYVVDFGDCRSNRFVGLNMTLIKQNGAKLHERIVRCQDCKYWRRFYPESEQRFGTCRAWRYTTRFDGYCHNASKSDGERQGE